jgi:hypothetical protein
MTDLDLTQYAFAEPASTKNNVLPILCLDNGVYNLRLNPAHGATISTDRTLAVLKNASLLNDGLRLITPHSTAAKVWLERLVAEDLFSADLNRDLFERTSSILSNHDAHWLANRRILASTTHNDLQATPLSLQNLFVAKGWPINAPAVNLEERLPYTTAAARFNEAQLCTGSRAVLNDMCFEACTGASPTTQQRDKVKAFTDHNVRSTLCRGTETDNSAACKTCDSAALAFCQATGAADAQQRAGLDPLVLSRCACLASPLRTMLAQNANQTIRDGANALPCVSTCGTTAYLTQALAAQANACPTNCQNLYTAAINATSLNFNHITQACRILAPHETDSTPFVGLTFNFNQDGQLTVKEIQSAPLVPPPPPSVVERIMAWHWGPTFHFPPHTALGTMLQANTVFLSMVGGGLVLVFGLLALGLWAGRK